MVTPTRQTARILEGMTHTPIEVVPYGIPAVQPLVGKVQRPHAQLLSRSASLEPRKGQDILVASDQNTAGGNTRSGQFQNGGTPPRSPVCREGRESAAGLTRYRVHRRTQSCGIARAAGRIGFALICPSRDETMPITILEAMSLGKVIISADVGGIAEWLRDEMNGLLVSERTRKRWRTPSSAASRIRSTRCATRRGRAANF